MTNLVARYIIQHQSVQTSKVGSIRESNAEFGIEAGRSVQNVDASWKNVVLNVERSNNSHRDVLIILSRSEINPFGNFHRHGHEPEGVANEGQILGHGGILCP